MKAKTIKRISCCALIAVCVMIPAASPGTTYEYDSLNRLVHVAYDDGRHVYYVYDAAGNIVRTGPTDSPTGVTETPRLANDLLQNYPNPFNPTTVIGYSIRERTHVSLRIYNVAGQLVRTLVDEVQTPTGAVQSVTWDGVNDRGQQVASGVYFYRLVLRDFVKTRKMVLLK